MKVNDRMWRDGQLPGTRSAPRMLRDDAALRTPGFEKFRALGTEPYQSARRIPRRRDTVAGTGSPEPAQFGAAKSPLAPAAALTQAVAPTLQLGRSRKSCSSCSAPARDFDGGKVPHSPGKSGLAAEPEGEPASPMPGDQSSRHPGTGAAGFAGSLQRLAVRRAHPKPFSL